MSKYDLSKIQMTGHSGLDDLFRREKHLLSPHKTASRKKVATLKDLSGFVRIASNTLIHKSEKDLWELKKNADGSFFIERLFDDDGNPLKG